MKTILLFAALLTASLGCFTARAADGPAAPAAEAQVAPAKPIRVLAFSKTTGFRHGRQIELAQAMLNDFAKAGEIAIDEHSGENGEAFTDEVLKNVDVVVFLHATDNGKEPILDAGQRAAFESFIKRGGGWVGIHGAGDAGRQWPFFTEMLGAHFKSHPHQQLADFYVVDGNHPATKDLPDCFRHFEELYDFDANIHGKPGFNELLRVEEKSYHPATPMGADHPMAWTHEYAGGRCFYTELGHVEKSYSRPWFRKHVLGGIRWAAGREK